jgi:8-oxo-dGTP pyrophosphatase MutT (NUDIX family)
MALTRQQLAELPSPFYRVATRAIILDDQQRMLVAQDEGGNYELPGGGWEFDESFEECLARELLEEFGVELADVEPGVVCVYRGDTRYGMMLRIAVRATLKNHDFKPAELLRPRFVARDEFMTLDLTATANEGIKAYADLIWPQK